MSIEKTSEQKDFEELNAGRFHFEGCYNIGNNGVYVHPHIQDAFEEFLAIEDLFDGGMEGRG